MSNLTAGQGAGRSPQVRVDDTDLAFLRLLRDHGRLSVAALAEQVHVSRANAYHRLARLQDEGVLQGYSARVDSRRLNLGVSALLLISVKQTAWRELEEKVRRYPEVEYFAYTTGTYDALMLVRVPNLETLRDVILERLHMLPEIRSTHTIFLLAEPIRRPYVLPSS